MSPVNFERIQWGSAVLVFAAAGFFLGHHFAPVKVETKVVDRVVEKIVKVETAAKVETRVVYRDRVITKDGTVTEHEVEKTDAKSEVVSKVEDAKTTDHAAETKSVREDWRIGVLVGAQVQAPALPIAGPLVLGATVERRIIGPVWLGAWGTTGGAAGGSVSITF